MIDNVMWFAIGYVRILGVAVVLGIALGLFTAAALWRVRLRMRAERVPRARAVKLDAVTFERVRRGEIKAFTIAHTSKCRDVWRCTCPAVPMERS